MNLIQLHRRPSTWRDAGDATSRSAWLAGAVSMVVSAALVAPAFGGQPIYYPAKGQSSQKQQSDVTECQTWAKQSTGIDPVALAQSSATQQQSQPQQRSRLRGAAGGAAAGAAIGAIAGDAGKGAAIGAVTGTVGAGVRERRQQQSAAQQAQASQQNTQSQIATFNRAVTACMNGRGYTSQ